MSNLTMLKTLVAIVAVATASVAAHASGHDKYPVSPLVYQVTVKRVGDVLFRYVEFFEQYPCLRLETFTEGDLKPIDRMELCKFPTDGQVIDVTKERLTGVIHENFRLEGNKFNFSTDIIFARPGNVYLNCSVSISNVGKLSGPLCRKGERPSESEVNK